MHITDANLGDTPVVHLVNVFPHGRREGVMRAAPSALREEFLVRVRTREKRELGDPKKMWIGRQDEFASGLCVTGEQKTETTERRGPTLQSPVSSSEEMA